MVHVPVVTSPIIQAGDMSLSCLKMFVAIKIDTSQSRCPLDRVVVNKMPPNTILCEQDQVVSTCSLVYTQALPCCVLSVCICTLNTQHGKA